MARLLTLCQCSSGSNASWCILLNSVIAALLMILNCIKVTKTVTKVQSEEDYSSWISQSAQSVDESQEWGVTRELTKSLAQAIIIHQVPTNSLSNFHSTMQ